MRTVSFDVVEELPHLRANIQMRVVGCLVGVLVDDARAIHVLRVVALLGTALGLRRAHDLLVLDPGALGCRLRLGHGAPDSLGLGVLGGRSGVDGVVGAGRRVHFVKGVVAHGLALHRRSLHVGRSRHVQRRIEAVVAQLPRLSAGQRLTAVQAGAHVQHLVKGPVGHHVGAVQVLATALEEGGVLEAVRVTLGHGAKSARTKGLRRAPSAKGGGQRPERRLNPVVATFRQIWIADEYRFGEARTMNGERRIAKEALGKWRESTFIILEPDAPADDAAKAVASGQQASKGAASKSSRPARQKQGRGLARIRRRFSVRFSLVRVGCPKSADVAVRGERANEWAKASVTLHKC
eukprot:scaffold655_cov225-Pinguiococcus_pyrenoidosus.AAC.9